MLTLSASDCAREKRVLRISQLGLDAAMMARQELMTTMLMLMSGEEKTWLSRLSREAERGVVTRQVVGVFQRDGGAGKRSRKLLEKQRTVVIASAMK